MIMNPMLRMDILNKLLVEDGYTKQAPLRYLDEFTEMEPEIVDRYFNKCLWDESKEEE